ncbi:MAG: rod shape-determining protein MreD [Chitinophagales bacterium]
MNNTIFINIVRFVGIVLFQVLILNQIEIHGFISPYIYPLFILLLPFETPPAILLLLGFLTGISVDMFVNTPGLHAASTVFLAYLRPFVVRVNQPPGDYESTDRPNMHSMGLNWFLVYAGIAIILHHFCFFFLEIFSLSYLLITISKILFSSILSLALIIIYQYLFNPKL